MIVEKKTAHLGVFEFVSGKQLDDLVLVYEVYGKLNARKDNAILLSHTLTASQHAAGVYHASDKKAGWWDQAIGLGKDLDTTKYCIICINFLGGAHGSSGPKCIDSSTRKPYAMTFPQVRVMDMVNAEKKLMDVLGIRQWHCLIGGCMGGFKTVQWLASYPSCCKHAVLIATDVKVSVHTVASWYVMKQCIIRDPAWKNGQYGQDQAGKGLAFANMVGSMLWRSRDFFESTFSHPAESDDSVHENILAPSHPVEHFLSAIIDREDTVFDPNCLLYLMQSMTLFNLDATPNWIDSLAKVRGDVLCVSYRSDWRYPFEEMAALVTRLQSHHVNACHQVIESAVGHGGFIYDYPSLSPVLKPFLVKIT